MRAHQGGGLVGALSRAIRAREAQTEVMLEDTLAIADDGSKDVITVDGKPRVDKGDSRPVPLARRRATLGHVEAGALRSMVTRLRPCLKAASARSSSLA